MTLKNRLGIFLENIDRHEIFLLSGSLAYSTALALAPFVMILLSVASFFDLASRADLADQMMDVIGPEAGEAMILIMSNAERTSSFSGLSGGISFLVILLSASAIFYQLRVALNKVNEFAPNETRSSGWNFIRDRLLSVGLVLGFIFLLMLSLVVNAFISVLFVGIPGQVWSLLSSGLSFVLFSLVFMAMFRFIPSGFVSWRRCVLSGITASLFFSIGKSLIGLYLGTSALASAYGAAGSLVVLLIWLYYTSLTLLLSHEFAGVFLVEIETKAFSSLLRTHQNRTYFS